MPVPEAHWWSHGLWMHVVVVVVVVVVGVVLVVVVVVVVVVETRLHSVRFRASSRRQVRVWATSMGLRQRNGGMPHVLAPPLRKWTSKWTSSPPHRCPVGSGPVGSGMARALPARQRHRQRRRRHTGHSGEPMGRRGLL